MGSKNRGRQEGNLASVDGADGDSRGGWRDCGRHQQMEERQPSYILREQWVFENKLMGGPYSGDRAPLRTANHEFSSPSFFPSLWKRSSELIYTQYKFTIERNQTYGGRSDEFFQPITGTSVCDAYSWAPYPSRIISQAYGILI